MPLSESIPAIENADVSVDRHISELKDTCDKIARILLELCELQPLIQTALGTGGPPTRVAKRYPSA